MSVPPEDRDSEQTVDWRTRQPSAPLSDDGEATTALPARPHPEAATAPAPPTPPAPGGYQGPVGQGRPAQPRGGWGPPPAPPGGYQPGYPAAPPPITPVAVKPGSNGRTWLIMGAAAVVVAVIASGGTWLVMRDKDSGASSAAGTTSTSTLASASKETPTKTSTTKAAPQPIAPAAATGLLRSIPDISALLGEDMTPTDIVTEPYGPHIIRVDPILCTGASLPGMQTTYLGAEYTGFAAQLLSGAVGVGATQAVTTFRTEAAAQQFLDRQVKQWQECANTELTSTTQSGGGQGVVGAPSTVDGITSMVNTTRMRDGQPVSGQCERAITSRNNVVIDTRVCGPEPETKARTLAQDIAQTVSSRS